MCARVVASDEKDTKRAPGRPGGAAGWRGADHRCAAVKPVPQHRSAAAAAAAAAAVGCR